MNNRIGSVRFAWVLGTTFVLVVFGIAIVLTTRSQPPTLQALRRQARSVGIPLELQDELKMGYLSLPNDAHRDYMKLLDSLRTRKLTDTVFRKAGIESGEFPYTYALSNKKQRRNLASRFLTSSTSADQTFRMAHAAASHNEWHIPLALHEDILLGLDLVAFAELLTSQAVALAEFDRWEEAIQFLRTTLTIGRHMMMWPKFHGQSSGTLILRVVADAVQSILKAQPAGVKSLVKLLPDLAAAKIRPAPGVFTRLYMGESYRWKVYDQKGSRQIRKLSEADERAHLIRIVQVITSVSGSRSLTDYADSVRRNSSGFEELVASAVESLPSQGPQERFSTIASVLEGVDYMIQLAWDDVDKLIEEIEKFRK